MSDERFRMILRFILTMTLLLCIFSLGIVVVKATLTAMASERLGDVLAVLSTLAGASVLMGHSEARAHEKPKAPPQGRSGKRQEEEQEL